MNDLAPLMTDTIDAWVKPYKRTATGMPIKGDVITYSAHITYAPDMRRSQVPGASSTVLTAPAATVWLVDHPGIVAVGDIFTLPDGSDLKAARTERRSNGINTITKVFLS